jgi:hypothetical protein
VLRSGTSIDYGYLPAEDAAQFSALASQGYTTTQWQGWGTTYFLMNFQNPKTGPIIAQAYIRQAMQSLIDEPAYLKGPLGGFGHTDYGPVPVIPSNPYIDAYEAKGPWPYSPATPVKPQSPIESLTPEDWYLTKWPGLRAPRCPELVSLRRPTAAGRHRRGCDRRRPGRSGGPGASTWPSGLPAAGRRPAPARRDAPSPRRAAWRPCAVRS